MNPSMLRWYLCFAAVLMVGVAQTGSAQIPNAGFENWTAGDPDGWSTSNSPPTLVNVTISTDVHSGTKAVQGAVASIGGFGIGPALFAGTEGNGFPYTGRPGALHGFYKYSSSGSDALSVNTVLSHNGTGVGAGTFSTTSPSGAVYREFVANYFYGLPDNPDTAYITVTINNSPLPHVGSVFVLDDLAFGPAVTDVKEVESPQSFVLSQNYPNPFNPSTTITFVMKNAEQVNVTVYNSVGQEIATLFNGIAVPNVQYTLTFNGTNLSSGSYFYALHSASRNEVKKMSLMK